MNNSKQSSVEWLINEIQRRVAIIQSEPQTMARELMINNLAVDLEQAKAMHRKEIIEARQNGLDNGFSNGSWDSQLYYTEEFGGNNEQQ